MIARTDPFGLALDIKTLLLVRTGQQIIEFFGRACAIDCQDVLGDSSHHVEVEHRDGLCKIESGVIDVVLAADEAEFFGAEGHKEDTTPRFVGGGFFGHFDDATRGLQESDGSRCVVVGSVVDRESSRG